MDEATGTRRRPDDVHQRLLDAAERVFVRHGLTKATVTQISQEADVSLSVLYRHFDSKYDLFREAVLTPFLRFLEQWTQDIEGSRPRPSYEVTRNLIRAIFDQVGEHPHALSLLLAADVLFDRNSNERVHAQLSSVLDSLSVLAEGEVRRNGMPGAETIGLHTRLVFGMTLGVLQWQPWLLGHDSPADREGTIDAITNLVWHGVGRALGE